MDSSARARALLDDGSLRVRGILRAFDPSEPRDPHGEWSKGGALVKNAAKALTGSPEQLHDDEAAIRETFNFHDSVSGLTAEVESIGPARGDPSTFVRIKIRDKDGKEVGHAGRWEAGRMRRSTCCCCSAMACRRSCSGRGASA